MSEGKILYIGIWLIIQASPFFFWLVLYLANPQSQIELRTQIARVKLLRWISYIGGIVFFLFCLIDHQPTRYWFFGSGVLTASIGLVFPDNWLKNRLARSQISEISPPTAITPIV
jgi:hypothetical protein